MRPTKQELNEKIWHRIFKVLAFLVLIGAIIAPWIVHEPDPFLLIDSGVNVLIWLVVLLVLRSILLYVIYGKKERAPEDLKRLKEWAIWGPVIVILIVGFIAFVIYSFK